MKPRKKARRPRERTARKTGCLCCRSAFYADSHEHSMIEGYADAMRGYPHHVRAFGTIGTEAAGTADRAVVFDARKVIGSPERVMRADGRERCEVAIRTARGRIERLALDVVRDQAERVIGKARR